MRWKAKIEVTLRKEILDPQGAAVESVLRMLQYTRVTRVRVGKYIELVVEAPGREEAAGQVAEMCRRVLANPASEDYHFILQEVEKA